MTFVGLRYMFVFVLGIVYVSLQDSIIALGGCDKTGNRGVLALARLYCMKLWVIL